MTIIDIAEWRKRREPRLPLVYKHQLDDSVQLFAAKLEGVGVRFWLVTARSQATEPGIEGGEIVSDEQFEAVLQHGSWEPDETTSREYMTYSPSEGVALSGMVHRFEPRTVILLLDQGWTLVPL
jgi:hypothetical protein